MDTDKIARVFLDRMLKHPQKRSYEIMVKKWGKYFSRKPTPYEWANNFSIWNFGIIEDITSEEEAQEFCVKMKLVVTHNDGDMPHHFFLCPNYSETEMAILGITPHVLLDGTSFLQTMNLWSDEMNQNDDYYPFLPQKSIGFINWFLIYATFPL